MAYCSVCGLSNQTDDRVCAGCGSELAREPEQEHGTHPFNGDAAVFNRELMNGFSGFGMVVDQDLESQLGKGLIKPHAIELEIDGFHFKYDKPARNFAKTENVKEKVVEFRLTCPDSSSETIGEETSLREIPQEDSAPDEFSDNHQTVENQETTEAKAVETNLVDAGPVEEPVEGEAIDTIMESDDPSQDQEMWVAGEISTGTGANFPVESEFIPGFELPEPELETDEDRVILWEDSQRWFGIPLNNQYRISNNSLQIIDRLARKFSEVDLTLISEVRLHQSWWDKLFKTGDLSVSVKHLPEKGLKLSGVHHPEKVYRLLEALINNPEDNELRV